MIDSTNFDYREEAIATQVSLENTEEDLFRAKNELVAYRATVENLERGNQERVPAAWLGRHTAYPDETVLFKTEYEAQDWLRQFRPSYAVIVPLDERVM